MGSLRRILGLRRKQRSRPQLSRQPPSERRLRLQEGLQVGSQNSGSGYYGVKASSTSAASGPVTAAKKIKIPEEGKERTNKLWELILGAIIGGATVYAADPMIDEFVNADGALHFRQSEQDGNQSSQDRFPSSRIFLC